MLYVLKKNIEIRRYEISCEQVDTTWFYNTESPQTIVSTVISFPMLRAKSQREN